MLIWEWATATGIPQPAGGLIEVSVALDSGAAGKAYGDPAFIGQVHPGDRLLLNTTAVHLDLGTGGYHFIHMNAGNGRAKCEHAGGARSSEPIAGSGQGRHGGNRLDEKRGHIMKLRYTPLQHAVLAAEEAASPFHEVFSEKKSLAGMPVLIGELHSMLPIAAAWLVQRSALTVSYIMTDGSALPLALSRHAAELKRLGWIRQTITSGQAYGGDIETVNKFTSLLAARWVAGTDTAIIAMGPGMVGTETRLGHSGMEVGEWVNAVRALQGVPIVIPRLSAGDARERHRGISHHTLAALQVAAREKAIVPLPITGQTEWDARMAAQAQSIAKLHELRWIQAPSMQEIAAVLTDYPLPVTTMGRSAAEDPLFFQAVCCAAETVRLWLERADSPSSSD
ncbi:DUF3866 family protein [Xylanibacillus composti]|uniref:DUF3866 family protein n=1 Tax=Xylanibacillus composti TaxID=1572762 RepID=A0A8J4H5W2_9BACL|nr:DUF3866 family protein [Xylanibacillus composti]MDT9726654.1 DUF3866 family protein [Xylanibacillus composti]GIQ69414.1 hypothetical protein XYCOK13_22380 [Xylanibacillus composti]